MAKRFPTDYTDEITSPNNNDKFMITDSALGESLKRILWSTIKTVIRTFTGLTGKTTPASNDLFIINDSADTYNSKKLTYNNLLNKLYNDLLDTNVTIGGTLLTNDALTVDGNATVNQGLKVLEPTKISGTYTGAELYTLFTSTLGRISGSGDRVFCTGTIRWGSYSMALGFVEYNGATSIVFNGVIRYDASVYNEGSNYKTIYNNDAASFNCNFLYL